MERNCLYVNLIQILNCRYPKIFLKIAKKPTLKINTLSALRFICGLCVENILNRSGYTIVSDKYIS
jgi:hypothetical protein